MKTTILCNLFVFLWASNNAIASIAVFQDDLAGFNAAAGTPAIGVDFDSIATGSNIAGNAINGVTFSSPSANTLDVVTGTSTFTPSGFTGVVDANTNRLFPTSGANVLSPGGAALVPGSDIAEEDSLILDFSSPVSSFGVDVLFQSLDFSSATSYKLFDSALTLLMSGSVDTSSVGGLGGSPGGAFFIGFFSDDVSTNIARIIFTESDGNSAFPDSNIGYDTLRFNPVPIPGAFLLFGSGLFVLFGLKRRA